MVEERDDTSLYALRLILERVDRARQCFLEEQNSRTKIELMGALRAALQAMLEDNQELFSFRTGNHAQWLDRKPRGD